MVIINKKATNYLLLTKSKALFKMFYVPYLIKSGQNMMSKELLIHFIDEKLED